MTNKDLEEVIQKYCESQGYKVRQVAIDRFDGKDSKYIEFAGRLNLKINK